MQICVWRWSVQFCWLPDGLFCWAVKQLPNSSAAAKRLPDSQHSAVNAPASLRAIQHTVDQEVSGKHPAWPCHANQNQSQHWNWKRARCSQDLKIKTACWQIRSLALFGKLWIQRSELWMSCFFIRICSTFSTLSCEKFWRCQLCKTDLWFKTWQGFLIGKDKKMMSLNFNKSENQSHSQKRIWLKKEHWQFWLNVPLEPKNRIWTPCEWCDHCFELIF